MSRRSISSLRLSAPRGWCAISDLHLSEDLPQTVARFETFCHEIAVQYDALFILGDLFEYWVGDDAADLNPAALRVIAATCELQQRGTQVYFMRGNRDIALGTAYCRRAGMTLLDDPCIFTTEQQPNHRILLTHGDLLCTDDVEYQRQRRIYAHPWVKGALLRLPLSWRVKLVQHLREKSKRRWRERYAELPAEQRGQRMVAQDVPESAVRAWQSRYQVQTLIHGHTHRPAEYRDDNNNNDNVFVRYVLPDWDLDKSSRWGYLAWTNHPVLTVFTE